MTPEIDRLEDAARRLVLSPTLTGSLVVDIRKLAGEARSTHPLGYAVIDAEMDRALSSVMACTSAPAALIEAERQQAAMLARRAEALAHDEVERARAEDSRLAAIIAGRRDAMRQEANQRIGAPVVEALETFRTRANAALQRIWARAIDDEDELAAALDDLHDAMKGIANAIGLARRESRLRVAAAEAERTATVAMSALAA